MNTKTFSRIRWMRHDDMALVKAIGDSFEDSVEHFLQRPRGIGNVIEINGKVVGFIFYELKNDKIKLVHLAVASEYRNQKIGESLIFNLISKLNKKRNMIQTSVSEYNTVAQLFFRKMGFKAVEVIKESYEDSYVFVFEGVKEL